MTNINIAKEEQNPLFDRKEVSISFDSEKSLNREEILKIVADKFKSKEDSIKILGINRKFGSKILEIDANIYPSKESKDNLEIKKKKEKDLEKKSETPVEEKVETPTEETPKEDSKEEKDVNNKQNKDNDQQTKEDSGLTTLKTEENAKR
ncbi:MAG: hypothetical protein ACE5ES_00940 [Candidatus Nanoarchaeia archaeon]